MYVYCTPKIFHLIISTKFFILSTTYNKVFSYNDTGGGCGVGVLRRLEEEVHEVEEAEEVADDGSVQIRGH